MSQLLIVGCGYVGRPVALAWQASVRQNPAGESSGVGAGNYPDSRRSDSSGLGSVWAMTRGGTSRQELEELGIPCIESDWLAPANRPAATRSLGLPEPEPEQFDHLLVAVPHRPDDRYGIETHAVGLDNLVRGFPNLKSIVVLSTTGVYGQASGETVDEDSPTEPTRPGPQIALAAERRLAELARPGVQAVSLRLSGIYGPQRIPLLSKLKSGEPLPVSDSGVVNLIHIDDITAVVLKLLQTRVSRSLYVLSDGHPAPRREFYRVMAEVFRTAPPTFIDPDKESRTGGRSESNKRIDAGRLLRELPHQLLLPDFRAGLAAIARAQPVEETLK